MRPSTPKNGRRSQGVGPGSPPETPATTAAGVFTHKRSLPEEALAPQNRQSRRLMHDQSVLPNRRAVGDSRGGSLHEGASGRPGQLSPQSSSSSLASSDSGSAGDGSSQASAGSEPPMSRQGSASPEPGRIVSHLTATFVIEELSDFNESDMDRLDVIRPHRIEDADTDRSRSRSRNPPEIERTILYNLNKLRCSDDEDDSDQSDIDEAEHLAHMARQRKKRRHKRLSTGSIGKRTITESLGSDSDREDLGTTFLDISEVGSSARRLRRRMGDRRSLQFQDPPPPRIDELEEPNTSDEDLAGSEEALARELPYYAMEYITMEIDSP